MIIHIDLSSMVFGLLMPFWCIFSVMVAIALGKRFEVFTIGSYVKQTVKKNNELMMKNKKLREELQEM